jgi:hypothetical protein
LHWPPLAFRREVAEERRLLKVDVPPVNGYKNFSFTLKVSVPPTTKCSDEVAEGAGDGPSHKAEDARVSLDGRQRLWCNLAEALCGLLNDLGALALRQVAADPSGRRTAGRLAKSERGEHDDLDVYHKFQSSAAIKPKILALCCVLAEHLGEGGWHRTRRLWVITHRGHIY